MKILYPILLAIVLSVVGLLYFNSEPTTSSDTNMLQLANFAFQQQRYNDAIEWYLKAAKQGESEAQYQLAQMYKHGQGVSKDEALSREWMQKAAHGGFAKAEFKLADILFNKEDSFDKSSAFSWYEKAANHGQPEAMLKLASILFADPAESDNVFTALDWATKAQKLPITKKKAQFLRQNIMTKISSLARKGNKRAQYLLAKMYLEHDEPEDHIENAKIWLTAAAKQGHLQAQYELSYLLSNEFQLLDESLYWMSLAAKSGLQKAGYALASQLSNIQNINSQDTTEAWRWLYHGVRSKEPQVLYNAATILNQGKLGLPKSNSKYKDWLTIAANNNIPFAQNDLAIHNILQSSDTKRSIIWLKKAAQSGDSIAQYNLGLLYARGESINPNDGRASHWWKQAAQSGNTKSYMMLALLFQMGRGVEMNELEAIEWYKKAAATGQDDALFNLAMIYYHGQGVDQDFGIASQYLKKLALKGDTHAQNIYGSLFLESKGVKYNPEKALYWFTQAAKAGNPTAMFNLASLYRSGTGVPQDDKKAMIWYKESAKHEYAAAQNALGYLYAEGRGAKKDLEQAHDWFIFARNNGLRLANNNIDALRNHGSFTLVSFQVDTRIRSDVLINKTLDLSQWLDLHQRPIL